MLRGSQETPRNHCNKSIILTITFNHQKIIEMIKNNQKLFGFLPQTFLCSRMPLQGDGIGNDVCDGELSHFEGRWQDCTLWRHNQGFNLMTAAVIIKTFNHPFHFNRCFYSSADVTTSWWTMGGGKCHIPAGHILWPQLRQHSAWCSAPSQRTCWFSLWQLGSWKLPLRSLLHRCLPFSVLREQKHKFYYHTNQEICI